MTPKKLTSLEGGWNKERAEIIADQAHWKKCGANRRNTPSKSEIMEELSRKRFLWDE